MAAPTSSFTSPSLPSGVLAFAQLLIFSWAQSLPDSAVGKKPGAMELTLTPCLPHSLASARVIISTPALLIA
jgi:hypothetical protein